MRLAFSMLDNGYPRGRDQTMTFIRPVLLMIALLACLQACGADTSGESTAAGEPLTYKVYFLAGQSNMDGHGKVKELQPDMNAPVEGVYIFEGRMLSLIHI